MRKLPASPIDLDPGAPRDSRRILHRLLLVALGLSIAAPASEAVSLCAASWRAISGRVDRVETPVLDAIAATGSDAARAVRLRVNRAFRTIPLRPSLVIPLGIAWALLLAILLRRS